jgi:hypothetical protein
MSALGRDDRDPGGRQARRVDVIGMLVRHQDGIDAGERLVLAPFSGVDDQDSAGFLEANAGVGELRDLHRGIVAEQPVHRRTNAAGGEPAAFGRCEGTGGLLGQTDHVTLGVGDQGQPGRSVGLNLGMTTSRRLDRSGQDRVDVGDRT